MIQSFARFQLLEKDFIMNEFLLLAVMMIYFAIIHTRA